MRLNLATEAPPRAALEHFGPATAGLTWRRAPGGFSGSAVWRGDDPSGAPRVALKGWPPQVTAERVREVHGWLARAAHLPFVPVPFVGARGVTAVTADERLWDACPWVPGAALAAPTAADVGAACEAVARLHLVWPAQPARPCAAVAARLQMLTDHRALYAPGAAVPSQHPGLIPLLARAAGAVRRGAGAAVAALNTWVARPVGARPCVRDLRGEHVLFHEGRVVGIVDYGAMAVDTPAGDLARLLSDYAGSDPAFFDDGLRAYRAAGGPLGAPDELVRVLAGTGALCSLLGWLVRLHAGGESSPDSAAVAARIEHLLAAAGRLHF